MVRDMPSRFPDAEEQPGFQGVHPVEAAEIEAGEGTDPAILDWVAARVPHRQVYPVEVTAKSGGPDDAGDSLGVEVEKGNLGQLRFPLRRPVVSGFRRRV